MSEQSLKMVEKLVDECTSATNPENLRRIEAALGECRRIAKCFSSKSSRANSVGEKQKWLTLKKHTTSLIARLEVHKKDGSGNHSRAERTSDRVKFDEEATAFNRRLRTWVLSNLKHQEPASFMDDCCRIFVNKVSPLLDEYFAIKVNVTFYGKFIILKGDNFELDNKYIQTENSPIYRGDDFAGWFHENATAKILTELEEFEEKASGWALKAITNLSININQFIPKSQLGGSYIPLPPQIQNKKACINVQNHDNSCFVWSILAALHPVAVHAERVSAYKSYFNELNLNGLEFPLGLEKIPKFESMNNISVNVHVVEYYSKNGDIVLVPAYLTKSLRNRHVNLLMIQGENGNFHYVLIKKLSHLLSSQISKHKGALFFCDRCLCFFHSEEKRNKHIPDCYKTFDCKVKMPSADKAILEFREFKYKEKVPFVIYADFEAILKKTTKRNALQEHEACSVGYYVKCSYDEKLNRYASYHGSDCTAWFVQELNTIALEVNNILRNKIPMMELTVLEGVMHALAPNCHICEKPLSDKPSERIHDHCHLTGKYRGAAHNACNLEYQISHTIPVVFHNLTGYDAHFIIENLAQDFEGKVDVLPLTKEKYISFTKTVKGTKVKLRFIDSFRFLASSLDKLASYLGDYPILNSEFSNVSEESRKLLTRKGVFPYEYMDSWGKFDEDKLPKINAFYSKLTESMINSEEYEHAKNVFNVFNCKNLREYCNLYMKTDILLLADVFEQFRTECISTHKLDPAHYYTLPGFTWSSMLKFTKVKLELLTDVDMLAFIMNGIRGGLSQCSKRYAAANNQYMTNFDNNKPTSFIVYNDINNQYGWAMSEYLPHGGFTWVTDPENLEWRVDNKSECGYILEVDLEYPHELHDAHSDLPFCPEKKAPPKSKEPKLIATLENKRNYVIHYRALKQALEHGLTLTKIHRVLKFEQRDWLKSYIDLNTELRQKATSDFGRNLYKLMNNAVYGKTMENVMKRSNVKLATKWDGRYGVEVLVAKPEFKSLSIFNENLVAVELRKTSVLFNKPIYIGMAVLDIAKTTIYDFHYNYILNKFPSRASLCYTDTDSLIHEIVDPDYYAAIKPDINERFDTSDYPVDNAYGFPLCNKKVLGLMSDECSGKIITEFAGLRAKMYAYRVDHMDYGKRAKGVKQCVVKKDICFNDYVECLNTNAPKIIQQSLLKADKHRIYTIKQTKIGLSPHDNKRYLIQNSYNTLAWGHKQISEESMVIDAIVDDDKGGEAENRMQID